MIGAPVVADAPRARRWLLPAIVVLGIGLRIVLLPTVGFAGDIDQFVSWVGHIARDGLGHAYDVDISFGPVMTFIWWAIGLLDPAIAGAANSADPAVRVVMKLPAVAADLALATIAWYAVRQRPGWAAVAVGVILLHPAIWFVSAWWGTYDSIYVAFVVAALVLAIRGLEVPAVVALVLAVMTKPQAGPLVAPFAAWFLITSARELTADRILPATRRVAVLVATGMLTVFLLWVPFLAANGLGNYIDGLRRYQSELYGFLSLAAWNPWWLVQEIAAGGNLVQDSGAFIGGISYRLVGYAATACALGLICLCVARRPTARMLALGAATSALAAFELLTTMHERYAFAVLPLLVAIIDDRRLRWVAAVFGTSFFLNQVSASERYLGAIIPQHGPITVIGSVLNVAVLAYLMLAMWHDSRVPEREAAINAGAAPTGGRTPLGTSAGSGAATSGA